MPNWLINILIDLALKVGVPYLLKLFPWLPQNLMDIIQNFIDDIKGHSTARKATVVATREAFKTDILGMDPPADVKR
jgi:hypothetical protein